MADDELDLDAMLDSALDEEFVPSATAVEEGGQNECELDLDAMLDEAIESTLDGEGDQQPNVAPSGKGLAASGTRASSDFGPSQQWLQRKQGRRSATGGAADAGAREPFSFLRPERRAAWEAALAEDDRRQADMDKQRPLSRAYRSFYSAGKEDGAVVVHLGSGAAPAAAAGESVPSTVAGGGVGEKVDVEGADDIFEDVLGKGVASSGVKEPPSVGEGDYEALDRLKASYLRLVARDVQARVSKDPDVSAERFPGIASKILT